MHADKAAARAAADTWTANTGLKAQLLRDNLLREDCGWRVVPWEASDELRRLTKLEGSYYPRKNS